MKNIDFIAEAEEVLHDGNFSDDAKKEAVTILSSKLVPFFMELCGLRKIPNILIKNLGKKDEDKGGATDNPHDYPTYREAEKFSDETLNITINIGWVGSESALMLATGILHELRHALQFQYIITALGHYKNETNDYISNGIVPNDVFVWASDLSPSSEARKRYKENYDFLMAEYDAITFSFYCIGTMTDSFETLPWDCIPKNATNLMGNLKKIYPKSRIQKALNKAAF